MLKLNCLYFEDLLAEFEYFSEMLTRYMRPDELHFTVVQSPQDVEKILNRSGNDFELFFSDILVDNNRQGFIAIEAALRHDNIVVIAISDAEASKPGTKQEFKKRGGHLYIEKESIRDGKLTGDEITTRIRQALEAKGIYDTMPLGVEPGADIYLDAEIEAIGDKTLAVLLTKTLPGYERMELKYVAPGYSGASVLRVKAFKHRGASKTILVKLSHDERKLRKELDQAPDTGHATEDLYVRYDKTPPISYNGWYLISMTFAEDATTMLEWIGSSAAPINSLMNELFQEGLRLGYMPSSEGKNQRIEQPALALMKSSIRGRAHILTSLETLKDLVARAYSEADTNFDPNYLEQFLQYNQVGKHSEESMPQFTFQCMSHGDLHTRNILISRKTGRPHLIDAGLRGIQHWASDPARFCADLWLTAWDFKKEAYFWDDLPAWRGHIQSWLRSEGIPDLSPLNSRVYHTLSWVHENLPQMFNDLCGMDVPTWEYKLALAEEFLRMSGYDSFPAPKRCLGILAAYDILHSLESEIPRNKKSYKR